MKKLALLLMVCCMCTACGTKEESVTDVLEQVETVTEETVEAADEEKIVEEAVVEEVIADEGEEGGVETKVITPLPSTIDMSALDNCTLAVSFEKGDAYVDDEGAMQLKVTVYEYELFDMVDIANLKEGDTIVIQKKEVLVETMEILDSGLLFINGGMENGGYDLWHGESGVYFEHGYNDTKSYQPIGEATIKVSDEFEFVDSSDLDKGEVTFYPGDFLTGYVNIVYDFTPNNTSIVVENGDRKSVV